MICHSIHRTLNADDSLGEWRAQWILGRAEWSLLATSHPPFLFTYRLQMFVQSLFSGLNHVPPNPRVETSIPSVMVFGNGVIGRCVCVVVAQSCPTLCDHGLEPTRLLCPWDSPGKKTRVGCHALLQGIFPTQGSNPGLLHCRQILYGLSHLGSPFWKICRFTDGHEVVFPTIN